MVRNNFKVHDVEQGTSEWHKLREDTHTASQAGVAMGVAKTLTGEISPYLQSIFDYGHKVEAAARSSVEASHFGFGVLEAPTASCEIDGVKLLASLDGLCDGKIWECKSFGAMGTVSKDAELMIAGKVPDKHFWQMQQQMMVFDVKSASLTAATFKLDEDGNEFIYCHRPIEVLADKEAQAKLIERYKEIDAEINIEANKSVLSLMESYTKLKEEAATASAALKAVESEIKAIAKSTGAKTISGDNFNITLSSRIGSIDYSKIPELEGIDLDDYRKESSSFYTIKVTV